MNYSENTDSIKVGDRIKQRRLNLGLTLEELAKKVGISRSTMSRYETGIIELIPQQNIDSIAAALGTTGAALYGYVDDLNAERDATFRNRLSGLMAYAQDTGQIELLRNDKKGYKAYESVLSGSMPITISMAYDIANMLGVSLHYLIGTTDDPNDKSLPDPALLLDLEKRKELLRAETLQEKETIEHEAPDKIKAAQNVLLKAVMDICKDPAPLDETEKLYELEIMPARIIHVRDFLLLEDSLDFLSNNMPGLTGTTRPKRNNVAESELLFYFRNAAPELQKAALAVLKSAASEKISTSNEE